MEQNSQTIWEAIQEVNLFQEHETAQEDFLIPTEMLGYMGELQEDLKEVKEVLI